MKAKGKQTSRIKALRNQQEKYQQVRHNIPRIFQEVADASLSGMRNIDIANALEIDNSTVSDIIRRIAGYLEGKINALRVLESTAAKCTVKDHMPIKIPALASTSKTKTVEPELPAPELFDEAAAMKLLVIDKVFVDPPTITLNGEEYVPKAAFDELKEELSFRPNTEEVSAVARLVGIRKVHQLTYFDLGVTCEANLFDRIAPMQTITILLPKE